MPKFHKAIVREGRYKIGDAVVDITADRLESWASTANQMVEEGLRIPAPWYHDLSSVPVQMGTDGTLPSSEKNAGYWERFWVETQENGKRALCGLLDVPGKPDDPNTPAGKVGTTVRDTSIYVRPEFVDGKGKSWKDAIMHVALVTHPIEPGQSNFYRADSSHLALSMAHEMVEPDKTVGDTSLDGLRKDLFNIADILRALREIAEISLPDDTTSDNFFDRLKVALLQKQIEKVKKKFSIPEGSKEPNAPLTAMAHITKEQFELLMSLTNPKTGKAFTAEELKALGFEVGNASSDEALKKMVAVNKILMSHINQVELKSRKDRIDALVRSGRITKEYAEKELLPLLAEFQMSYDENGNPRKHTVDYVLDALDKVAPASLLSRGGWQFTTTDQKALAAAIKMSSGQDVEIPENVVADLSEEDAAKIADAFCRNVGWISTNGEEK